ncbi:hypothetical protein RCL_jg3696.t1 [Rhizophagus clarus]|uniref:Uncharacterized protein n=1 Tax=Rhizophagus clarus TaxID=94130 RepID=A0A8H3QZJ4_9GLOM|nr:hypothetical protein RCL_jg3696.t1 [Rhizophagus clarus]
MRKDDLIKLDIVRSDGYWIKRVSPYGLARYRSSENCGRILKLIMAVKVILSWKAQTRKNTLEFYKALKKGTNVWRTGSIFLQKKDDYK